MASNTVPTPNESIDLSDMNGPPYGELNFLLLLFLLPVIDEIFRLPISFF